MQNTINYKKYVSFVHAIKICILRQIRIVLIRYLMSIYVLIFVAVINLFTAETFVIVITVNHQMYNNGLKQ